MLHTLPGQSMDQTDFELARNMKRKPTENPAGISQIIYEMYIVFATERNVGHASIL